jgi:hypothetical protein
MGKQQWMLGLMIEQGIHQFNGILMVVKSDLDRLHLPHNPMHHHIRNIGFLDMLDYPIVDLVEIIFGVSGKRCEHQTFDTLKSELIDVLNHPLGISRIIANQQLVTQAI